MAVEPGNTTPALLHQSRWKSLLVDAASGASLGWFTGILVGLSASPVVATLLGGIVTAFAAFFGFTSASASRVSSNGAVRLMSFAVLGSISVLAGVYMRTHDTLSPPPESRLVAIGFTPAEAKQQLKSEYLKRVSAPVAKADNSRADNAAESVRETVLHGVTTSECQSLNPSSFNTLTQLEFQWNTAGGKWAEFVKSFPGGNAWSEEFHSAWRLACEE